LNFNIQNVVYIFEHDDEKKVKIEKEKKLLTLGTFRTEIGFI
jgi:hypothetical protein